MSRCSVPSFLLISLCLASAFFAMPSEAKVIPGRGSDLYDTTRPRVDPKKVPVLKNLTKGGGELFYLGERSGLSGWFLVRNHQVQMLYVTPDQKSILIGAMFTSDGENVTTQQVAELTSKDDRVRQLIETTGREEEAVIRAGGMKGGVAAVPSQEVKDSLMPKREILPTIAASPGDRLYQDLAASAGLELGEDGLPEIQMVVASDCPKCESTWKELLPALEGKKVRVRIIPIYNEGNSEQARQAAQLLRADKPLEVWNKYVAGDKSVLAGKADPLALRAVKANLNLITRWNISGLPYLVYRNKDEKVKIVQGRPDRMATVLMDLIEEKE